MRSEAMREELPAELQKAVQGSHQCYSFAEL